MAGRRRCPGPDGCCGSATANSTICDKCCGDTPRAVWIKWNLPFVVNGPYPGPRPCTTGGNAQEIQRPTYTVYLCPIDDRFGACGSSYKEFVDRPSGSTKCGCRYNRIGFGGAQPGAVTVQITSQVVPVPGGGNEIQCIGVQASVYVYSGGPFGSTDRVQFFKSIPAFGGDSCLGTLNYVPGSPSQVEQDKAALGPTLIVGTTFPAGHSASECTTFGLDPANCT